MLLSVIVLYHRCVLKFYVLGISYAGMMMFQGKDSSDEEDPLDVPDDDQYDTDDSFIDDADLVGNFAHCFGLFADWWNTL